jgi:hypothetical protein
MQLHNVGEKVAFYRLLQKMCTLHEANCAERLINENSDKAELFYDQCIIEMGTQIESLTCLYQKLAQYLQVFYLSDFSAADSLVELVGRRRLPLPSRVSRKARHSFF